MAHSQSTPPLTSSLPFFNYRPTLQSPNTSFKPLSPKPNSFSQHTHSLSSPILPLIPPSLSSPDTSSPITSPTSHSPTSMSSSSPLPPLPTHSMITRFKANIFKHKALPPDFVSTIPPKPHCNSLSSSSIPTSVSQALKSLEWWQALYDDFHALLSTQTWDLDPYSSSMNIIGCIWVFRKKFLANGLPDKSNARLVAKGLHQQPGVDFT